MERNAFDLLGAEFSLGPAGQRRFNLDKMSSGMRFLLEANILAAPCVELVKTCPHCEYGSVAFIEDMGEFYFGNCDSCGANVLASKQELASCSFSESNFASFLVERLCDACQPENNGDYWFLGPAATCRSRWHIFFSISPSTALCNDILRQRDALLLVFVAPSGIEQKYSKRLLRIPVLICADEFGIHIHDESLDIDDEVDVKPGSSNKDLSLLRQRRFRDFLLGKVDRFRKQFLITQQTPDRLLFPSLAGEFLESLPEKLRVNSRTVRRDIVEMTGCSIGRNGTLIPDKKVSGVDKERRFDPAVYLALAKYDDPFFLGNDNPIWRVLKTETLKMSRPDAVDAILKQLEANERFRAFRQNVSLEAGDYDEKLHMHHDELIAILHDVFNGVKRGTSLEAPPPARTTPASLS